MFYKVWNADKADFASKAKMDKVSAHKVAEQFELRTRDMHVVVPA